jgi:hypothetical protein
MGREMKEREGSPCLQHYFDGYQNRTLFQIGTFLLRAPGPRDDVDEHMS